MSNDPPTIELESELGQYLGRLHAQMREMRGALIDQAIWLDVIITDVLASFFCTDDSRRLLLSSEVIAGRDSTFSGRVEILAKVVRRAFPEFATRHPKLFDGLGKIRKLRNRLAHAHLDTSEAFLAKRQLDRIQLVFYEDGETKTQVLTVDEFRQRLAEGSELSLALVELQGLVRAPA